MNGPEPNRTLSSGDLRDFEALLFDFDGVLADSEPFYFRSWSETLARWGVSVSEEEYYDNWTSRGEGLEGHVRRHDLEGIDPVEACAIQKEIYRAYCMSGLVPLMPGAAGLLRILSGEEYRTRHAIASNTDHDLVEAVLSAAGAEVPAIIGGHGLRHKPEPDIFLAASRFLGTQPGRTLVFEDAWKGLEAARRGGFRTTLVRNAINARMDLEADFEVESTGSISLLLDPGDV